MTERINVADLKIKATSQIVRKAGIRDYLEIEERDLWAQQQNLPIWHHVIVKDCTIFLYFDILPVSELSENLYTGSDWVGELEE